MSLEETYDQCLADGKLLRLEQADTELAKSLFRQAKSDWEEVLEFEKVREKKTDNYSRLYSNRYDVLRMLIHALAVSDQVKPRDHKCIAAHLCLKHPEYELDWDTLETMRMLRNNIQYRGHSITRDVWTSQKLKFDIYIRSLMAFMDEKLQILPGTNQ